MMGSLFAVPLPMHLLWDADRVADGQILYPWFRSSSC